MKTEMKVRTVTATGWACDSTGCHESGTLTTRWEFSDPSDWLIAVSIPVCGKAAKPEKE